MQFVLYSCADFSWPADWYTHCSHLWRIGLVLAFSSNLMSPSLLFCSCHSLCGQWMALGYGKREGSYFLHIQLNLPAEVELFLWYLLPVGSLMISLAFSLWFAVFYFVQWWVHIPHFHITKWSAILCLSDHLPALLCVSLWLPHPPHCCCLSVSCWPLLYSVCAAMKPLFSNSSFILHCKLVTKKWIVCCFRVIIQMAGVSILLTRSLVLLLFVLDDCTDLPTSWCWFRYVFRFSVFRVAALSFTMETSNSFIQVMKKRMRNRQMNQTDWFFIRSDFSA